MKVRLKKENFLRLLAKKNLSCRQFAHKIGFDSAQVTNWVTGKRFVSPNAREKIQRFLQEDWDDLFRIFKK